MNAPLPIQTASAALGPCRHQLLHIKNRLAGRWLRIVAAAVLSVAGLAHADQPPAIDFEVIRLGDGVLIQASATPRASLATTWNVLVGYERLPHFIPGMKRSEVTRHSAHTATVQQAGVASWGFFRKAFAVTLQVREEPLRSITAEAVAGDFSLMEARYELAAGAGALATRLVYRALVQPRHGIPPLLGVHVMAQVARQQFLAMVLEIERQEEKASQAPVNTLGL